MIQRPSRTHGHGWRVMEPVPAVYLVHGFACNALVFAGLAACLKERGVVATALHLDGYGEKADRPAAVEGQPATALLAAWADQLQVETSPGAIWLGWSLGGLVALTLGLRHPQHIRHLLLVATLPRFVQGPDWPHALADPELAAFRAALATDKERLLQRFTALAAFGDLRQKAVLRELRGALSPPPLEATLRAGLLVLEHADLRADVASLTCPTQIFLGENDAVVPVRAAAAWRALRPTTGSGQVPTTGSGPVPTTGSGPVQSMPVTVVPGAGHAPFLSAPGSFVEECLKARSCVPVHA